MHRGIVWTRTLLNPYFPAIAPKAARKKNLWAAFLFFRRRIFKDFFVGIGDSYAKNVSVYFACESEEGWLWKRQKTYVCKFQ